MNSRCRVILIYISSIFATLVQADALSHKNYGKLLASDRLFLIKQLQQCENTKPKQLISLFEKHKFKPQLIHSDDYVLESESEDGKNIEINQPKQIVVKPKMVVENKELGTGKEKPGSKEEITDKEKVTDKKLLQVSELSNKNPYFIKIQEDLELIKTLNKRGFQLFFYINKTDILDVINRQLPESSVLSSEYCIEYLSPIYESDYVKQYALSDYYIFDNALKVKYRQNVTIDRIKSATTFYQLESKLIKEQKTDLKGQWDFFILKMPKSNALNILYNLETMNIISDGFAFQIY